MSPSTRKSLLATLTSLALVTSAGLLVAGPLNPPAGSVASTYKTLAEVEPRIAINLANTPGDADSLFKITQPGSYYLAGNIQGVANKHGIEIASHGVAIDLNGFDLLGVAGSLDGVSATLAGASGSVVANGSVRSWGGDGVDLGSAPCIASRLRDLTCSGNAGAGIRTGFDAIVSDCVAYQNTAGGFMIASSTRITRCTASLNSAHGISAGGTCRITDCLTERNTQDGVRASSDCTIRANTCIANGNDGDGAGVRLSGGGNRVEDNLCSDGDVGIVAESAANFIVRNTCSGNAINFFFASNNIYGPVVNRVAPASAPVNGNSAATALGQTDANANFAF